MLCCCFIISSMWINMAQQLKEQSHPELEKNNTYINSIFISSMLI